MKTLYIKGSNDKPEINLDSSKGILFLGGSSIPENVMEIYGPVLNWIEEYMQNPNSSTTIDFFFEYLNTSSSHMIMRILEKILKYKDRCPELKINWCFLAGDVEMLHFGQELAELLNYPIELIEREP